MTPAHYEYTVRPGDSLNRIIYNMYGWNPQRQPGTYAATLKGVLALNPHITNVDRILSGTTIRLPEHPTSVVLQQVRPIILKQQRFLTETLPPAEKEQVTALAWLAHNTSWLTIPGGITMGATSTLLGPGNQRLLNEVGDLYAEYKTGRISRSTYVAQRAARIDQFRRNIGPLFERALYPDKGVPGAMRGKKNLLPPKLMTGEVARLQRIARHAAKGGVVLAGIGATSACIQIAHTIDAKEKNEIFVETVASTLGGFVAGASIGLFLVSNPVGWGTAVVLAIGSTGAGIFAGKFGRFVYDLHLQDVDLVRGIGLDKVCR
jgi:hypothetical protein